MLNLNINMSHLRYSFWMHKELNFNIRKKKVQLIHIDRFSVPTRPYLPVIALVYGRQEATTCVYYLSNVPRTPVCQRNSNCSGSHFVDEWRLTSLFCCMQLEGSVTAVFFS